jgi:biotin carboxyl carrier protein
LLPTPPPAAHNRPGRRAYLLIALFALALVLLPFLFWYSTWFGRTLSDSDLDQYFADTAKPRHAQHALVQLGERLSHGNNVSRWYPQVLGQAASSSVEIRQTAAWIMGQDPNYPPFHEALLRLTHDPEPMVRRNAALALSAFRDPAARPELVGMLRPYTVTASTAGALRYRLKVGDYVNPGTMIAHVGSGEVRSPVPGEVRALYKTDGAAVQPGDSLVALGADQHHVFEALRALVLVGEPDDLEDVQRFTRPMANMPEVVVRQAQLTRQAIESRK